MGCVTGVYMESVKKRENRERDRVCRSVGRDPSGQVSGVAVDLLQISWRACGIL